MQSIHMFLEKPPLINKMKSQSNIPPKPSPNNADLRT